MDNEITLRDYKAADGVKMLTEQGLPANEEWCAEAEGNGNAFTVFFGGKMIACAGIIKQREGVGLAWTLYPPDIGNYHVDPQVVKRKLKELMKKNNLWRVEATVRADFPKGEDYLRYLGFSWEGRMRKSEADKTDGMLYAIIKNG